MFRPNLTTKLVLYVATEAVTNPSLSLGLHTGLNILELGCGGGEIGYQLLSRKDTRQNISVYRASDIHEGSIIEAGRLFNSLPPSQLSAVQLSVRRGSLLSCWSVTELSETDLIINDVSAISDELLDIYDFFDGSVCNAGDDGLDNFREFLEQLQDYIQLSRWPGIIVPLLSLSDVSAFHELLRSVGLTSELMVSKEWPLPVEASSNNRDKLERLRNASKIWYHELGGMMVARTDVYYLKKP